MVPADAIGVKSDQCKAGDVFNDAISASSRGKGIGIKAIKPAGEPLMPSTIFSMYKIN